MSYIRLGIIAAVLLAFASLAAAMFYFKSEAASAEGARALAQSQLEQAAEVNRQSQEAIKRITEVRAADDAVLGQLNSAIEKLQSQQEEVRTGIAALERGNNEVRAYLSGKLPADLQRLLNRTRNNVPKPKG